MQTLIDIDMVLIDDCILMIIRDKYVNWMKLAHILSNFVWTLGPSFVHLSLLQNYD